MQDLKKNSKFDLFQKFQNQNFIFDYFKQQKSYRNEIHAPFLPSFDTQHFTLPKITSQGSEKTLKISNPYLK